LINSLKALLQYFTTLPFITDYVGSDDEIGMVGDYCSYGSHSALPGILPFAAIVMTKSLPCFMEATISTLYFMMTVNNPTWRDYSILI
jgi:hypothetical protein